MPRLAAGLLLLLLLLGAREGAAHYLGLTDTAVEIAAPGVRIVQTLPEGELAELDLPSAPTGAAGDPALQAVADGWQVSADGTACVLAAASARVLPALDARQFDLRFRCAQMRTTLEVAYPLAGRFASTHVNVARVLIGRGQFPFRFHRDRTVLRLPLQMILARSGIALPAAFREDDPNANLAQAGIPAAPGDGATAGADAATGADEGTSPPVATTAPRSPDDGEGGRAAVPTRDGGGGAAADPPALRGDRGGVLWTIAAIYLPSGIEHIVFGPDHLAFVLALVLVPLALRRLALAVTLFTLAHSITLGLAYFEVLALPPAVTEPLIALSVAAVGMENLLVARSAHVLRLRELTVFCFGLVHGIGLSYQLGALPAGSPLDALLRLLMFNVGVELGQLAILVFPGLVLMWAVRQDFGRAVTVAGSSLLVGLGAFWFLTRIAMG